MTIKKHVPEKTTVMLSNLHNAFLDEVSAAIRRETGAVISRSALLRAMITAVSHSTLSLSGCESEDAVRELIRNRLDLGHQ